MKGKMFGMMAAAGTILLSGAILISTAAISAQPVQAAEEHAAGSMQRQVEWGIAPFTSADISVELAEVSFLTAEDYGIEMVWVDERIKPNYKVSNGKLTVFTPSMELTGFATPRADSLSCICRRRSIGGCVMQRR